jgi:hypothetical protein
MHPRTLLQLGSFEWFTRVDMTFNPGSNLLAVVYETYSSFEVNLYEISNRNGADVGVELFQSQSNYDDPPHLIRFSPGEPLVRLRHVNPGEMVRIWDQATKTVQQLAYDENAHSAWALPLQNIYDWIYSRRTKTRLFWLPEYRRPCDSDCVDVHGDRLAIGSECGILTLLDSSRFQGVQE